MTEDLQQYTEQRYNTYFGNVLEVRDVLIEQYGEELVDSNIPSLENINFAVGRTVATDTTSEDSLGIDSVTAALHYYAGPFTFTIKFPTVRITNEYDKFIDIYGLFVQFNVTLSGRFVNRLQMIRTIYPINQLRCGYRHSHLPGFTVTNNTDEMKSSLRSWSRPCLGSGPIGSTIETLRITADRNFWSLFAYELSKYVTIESIQGGPYRRLEGVTNKSNIALTDFRYQIPDSIPTIVQEFVNTYAKNNKFKFSFNNNSYQLGESYEQLWINLSNSFIEFINHKNSTFSDTTFTQEELITSHILTKYSYSEGKIYDLTNDSTLGDISQLEGTCILKFKGVLQRLHIIVSDPNNLNSILLLNVNIYKNIILKILSIINFKYGTNKGTNHTNKQIPSGDIYFL